MYNGTFVTLATAKRHCCISTKPTLTVADINHITINLLIANLTNDKCMHTRRVSAMFRAH